MVADIGGTNARFAVVHYPDAELQCVRRYRCEDYSGPAQLVEAYRQELQAQGVSEPETLCMAVAAAVQHDRIRLTNRDWSFSRRELAAQTGLQLTVLNDFSAQAFFLAKLDPSDVDWIRRPSSLNLEAPALACRTVVGPGTGFGSSSLMPGGEVTESEPGHCSFAPVDEHEVALLQLLWQRYERVSVEHLLSGPGLQNLYWANGRLEGAELWLEPPQIVAAALDRSAAGHTVARRALRDFSAIAGSVSGDIALAMGSLGGFYLSGGLLQNIADVFDQTLFLERFNDKGPFRSWCEEVPIGVITARYPGLRGCAAFIMQHHLPAAQRGSAQAHRQ